MADKLHLIARPPNRGAWLLAWEIAQDGRIAEACAALDARGVGAVLLDRLLAGEVVPGAIIATAIAGWSNGRIHPRSWRQPAGKDWGTAPSLAHAIRLQRNRSEALPPRLRAIGGAGMRAERAARLADIDLQARHA